MNISMIEKYIDQKVTIELGTSNYITGKVIEFDDFGVHFIENGDNISDMLISWHDINKIILKPAEFFVISPL
jgi:small nuclear ribonucleoprotein (snRNP)-like protein